VVPVVAILLATFDFETIEFALLVALKAPIKVVSVAIDEIFAPTLTKY